MFRRKFSELKLTWDNFKICRTPDLNLWAKEMKRFTFYELAIFSQDSVGSIKSKMLVSAS